ncbi:MAG: hypothetical protein CMG55_03120 [Candidatus Marinimicrobia bacterium]|nr:hypothetical protein [Candidatus Neomarinimicrobiota bacterium]|tara:strand:- start:105 stop:1070 length:966 start_codon:yes stop_codon:yes gene_type:complete
MESIAPESIIVRLIADKPVRKTPYQVKGVFMKQFPNESIVPYLDGSFRTKYLYPRVQVKILNEQIYIIGLKEGVSPVLSLIESIETFNFGNITIRIEKYDIEENNNQFITTEKLLRYKFITPWVALNKNTSGKYRFVTDQEKPLFLNKLLGQNLLFLSKELGSDIKSKIYIKIGVDNLIPEKIDENGWGAFIGEFKTNYLLPSYIGLGNGITRGYGTLFSLNNPKSLIIDGSKENVDEYSEEDLKEEEEGLSFVTISDIPIINKRKKPKNRKGKKKKRNTHNNRQHKHKNFKEKNHQLNNNDVDDESRFNSAEYHQKQHDL